MMTHLGAGGWHAPDEQNSFEDYDVFTAKRPLILRGSNGQNETLSKSERILAQKFLLCGKLPESFLCQRRFSTLYPASVK
jgi:hypothetical protein